MQEDPDARRGPASPAGGVIPAEAQAWSRAAVPSAEPCPHLSGEKTCDYRFQPPSVGLGAGKLQVPGTDVCERGRLRTASGCEAGGPPARVTVAAAMQPTARHRWQKLFVRGRVILLLFLS